MRIVALALVLLVGIAHAEDTEGIAILKVAMAKEKEPGALDKALADLDALIKTKPKQADAHYARGWVLSRLDKVDAAVTAYDKAFTLDKTFADAAYNAGVTLARAKRQKDAAVRFDRAFAADPKHVDAAYNAGQTYYDLKQYAKAAQRWQAAAKLTPENFETAKKIVQAYMALGKDAEAMKARERVFEIKKTSKAPQIQKMKSYVFDQFDVGKFHIFVTEAFDTSGDLAYVYQFQVTEGDTTHGSINLETSAVIREQGTPFILGMDKGDKHTTFAENTWKTQPTYKAVKAVAIAKIKENF